MANIAAALQQDSGGIQSTNAVMTLSPSQLCDKKNSSKTKTQKSRQNKMLIMSSKILKKFNLHHY